MLLAASLNFSGTRQLVFVITAWNKLELTYNKTIKIRYKVSVPER